MDTSPLRIVLLGKTGNGKSASGNSILGKDVFESRLSFKSVTSECSEKTVSIFGKEVTVVDTPGILGNVEKVKCAIESSIPCLFLVVIKIDRFTEEEQKAVVEIKNILGPEGIRKSYILFTRGDNLKDLSVEDFIFEEKDGVLPKIVTSFDGRYHVFNNEMRSQDQVEDLLAKSGHLSVPKQVNKDERRIVLLGRGGMGKSASGNTILNLKDSNQFESKCTFAPVTKTSEAKSEIVDGRKVTVVDTPGIGGGNDDVKELFDEIMKTCLLTESGPHAFVFVFQIGRLLKEDIDLLDLLSKLFSEEAFKYAMVLFTHGDKLHKQELPLDEIQKDPHISIFLKKCHDRYCVFNNNIKESKQVRELLKKIDDMVEENRGECFSSGIHRLAHSFVSQHRALIAAKGRNDSKANGGDDSKPNGGDDSKPDAFTWKMFAMFLWESFLHMWKFLSSLVVSFCRYA